MGSHLKHKSLTPPMLLAGLIFIDFLFKEVLIRTTSWCGLEIVRTTMWCGLEIVRTTMWCGLDIVRTTA